MIDKFSDIGNAISVVKDGSVVMVGGFGASGEPMQLIDALLDQGARELTIVANGAGSGDVGMARLMSAGRVRKVICSFPGQKATAFLEGYRAGGIEAEILPQGTLAERIRAAGAGVAAFYTATGVGTLLTKGKPTETFNGKLCVLETALHADVALIEAWRGDRWGNLTYRSSGRNFNPIMATAASTTVVQIQHPAELGELDPESIVTPGIYVNHMVHIPHGDPPAF